MSETFLPTVKGMLLDPTPTLQSLRDEPLGGALKYYALLLLIPTALLTLLAAMGVAAKQIPGMTTIAGLGLFTAVFAAIIFIIGIISVLISGIIFHILGVYIAGGREGMGQTIKARAYASTPGILLSWIPLLNIIAAIWTLILFILGIRELQNLSTGEAVLAVVIPIVILILVSAVIIAALVFGTASNSF